MATLEEQETIINYLPAEKLVSVYSAYPPHMRRIMSDGRFTVTREHFDADGNLDAVEATTNRTSHLNILTIAQRPPRELTEEQRAEMSARMRSLHVSNKLTDLLN